MLNEYIIHGHIYLKQLDYISQCCPVVIIHHPTNELKSCQPSEA